MKDTNELKAASESGPLWLAVNRINQEAQGIRSYELVDTTGGALVRQYSLCNAPGERHRYVIAVLREENGRRGSNTLHDKVRVQDMLRVSRPRNHFELVSGARRVILLAGEVDHRDCILGNDEREQFITPCVARAKGGLLMLDL